MNVNQALVEGGYAIVDDYANNEFNPTIWTLYSPIEIIPEFQLFLLFPLFLFTTLLAIIIKIKIEKKNRKNGEFTGDISNGDCSNRTILPSKRILIILLVNLGGNPIPSSTT
jgi:hypothetical protein